MKNNMFKDAISACGQLEMSKHYDLATEFRCKSDPSKSLGMHVKGDFTVNAMQLLLCSAAIIGVCVVGSAVKMIKKKS